MPKTGRNERIKRQYMSLQTDKQKLMFLEDLAVMRQSNMLSDQEWDEFQDCVRDYFNPTGLDGQPANTVFDLRMSAYNARKLELQSKAGKSFLDMKNNYPNLSDDKLREAVAYTDQSIQRNNALDTYVMNFDLIGDDYKKNYIDALQINPGADQNALNNAFLTGIQKRYENYVNFYDRDDEAAVEEGEKVIDQNLDGTEHLSAEEKEPFKAVRTQHLGDLAQTAVQGKSFRDPSASINMEKLRELDGLYTELVAADKRFHINSGRYNDLVKNLGRVHEVYNDFKDQGLEPDAEESKKLLGLMDELHDVNETYLESKQILKNPDDLDKTRQNISERIRGALNPDEEFVKSRQEENRLLDQELEAEVNEVQAQIRNDEKKEDKKEEVDISDFEVIEKPKKNEKKDDEEVDISDFEVIEKPKKNEKKDEEEVDISDFEVIEKPKKNEKKDDEVDISDFEVIEKPKAEEKKENKGIKAEDFKVIEKPKEEKKENKGIRAEDFEVIEKPKAENKEKKQEAKKSGFSISYIDSFTIGGGSGFSISPRQKKTIAGDYKAISKQIKNNPEFKQNEELNQVRKSVTQLSKITLKESNQAAGSVMLNVAKMDNAINTLNNKGTDISRDTAGIIKQVQSVNKETLGTIAKCENKVRKESKAGDLKVENAIASSVAQTSNLKALKNKKKELGEIREKYEAVSEKIDKLEDGTQLKEKLKDSVDKITSMRVTSSSNEVVKNLAEINTTLNEYKGTDPKVGEISSDLKDLGMNTMVKAGQWMAIEKKMEIDAIEKQNRLNEIKKQESVKVRDNKAKENRAENKPEKKAENKPKENRADYGLKVNKPEKKTEKKAQSQAVPQKPQKSDVERRIEARRKRNAKKSALIKQGLSKFEKDQTKKKNNVVMK